MYAKVFRQIYDSTLAEDWRALVTFQQFLVLADSEGVVDMTPSAIHRITNIPADIITAGIEKLCQPDPASRSSSEDGRRIVRLDHDRDWGWRIVNYLYYRNLASREDKREKDRIRIAEKRNGNSSVASSREQSRAVANVAHTEAEANTYTERKALSGKPDEVPLAAKKLNGTTGQAVEVLQFLNDKTRRKFRGLDGRGRPTPNLKFIVARLESGATVQDCKTVIARKFREWSSDDKMRMYLRPETLFNATKFEQYLGECTTEEMPRG